jgi:hypothetical protein
MGIVPHRPEKQSEPSGIIRRPVNTFERHTDDVIAKRASASPQQLLRNRVVHKIVRLDVWIDFSG